MTHSASISRPALVRLVLAAALLLGLAVAFTVFAGNASAGGDTKITVNSTANIDDGACEGPPNDDEIGNCTLHEAIDMVNNGDADIINFHLPVFSKEQPGVIKLCDDDPVHGGEGDLPEIMRDIVIDSKDSGVIIDGGANDDDCDDPADLGLSARGFSNGFDFELNGGKNFTIRNIDGDGIDICGTCGVGDGASLGTITITGVILPGSYGGIYVTGRNLEHGSVTNSEVKSTGDTAVRFIVQPCPDPDLNCKISDSVLDISGNRIEAGIEGEDNQKAIGLTYTGRINSGTKVTIGVTQNEVINGVGTGVEIRFNGCGSGGLNVHVDENGEINGVEGDGVDVEVDAGDCDKASTCPGGNAVGISGCGQIVVDDGETSDNLEVVVTVNGNGDIENHDGDEEAVDIDINICCEESDSSATVEVNDNGRLTGEWNGVYVTTYVCCGDDNVSDVSVNNNDEITGEGADGILIDAFAGSSDDASVAGVAGFTGFDADDNVCTITIDGNNEIDGVGGHGIRAECFAGTVGGTEPQSEEVTVAGASLSSGDGNAATIIITNNSDIDGDDDGINADAIAGSMDGEADDNLAEVVVSGNGEITGDDGDGMEIDTSSGTPVEEGDDNTSIVTIEENDEIGGNGSDGIDVDSFAGGITDGSEDNSTEVTIVQNGSIEGSGDGDDGIELDSIVCCDPDNLNTITINNNKDEITGHDGGGIDIETCCSVNVVTVMDNAGNIRGGDGDGLELGICGVDEGIVILAGGEAATAPGFSFEEYVDCLKSSVTYLQVMNNSFSDSEEHGIEIEPGVFEDEELEIKSVISNNVIEGNGDDGIHVNSASGLNIGPNNEIFENGTTAGDNGIEINWCVGLEAWDFLQNKLAANGNRITQNSIWDNFGLGIDLVGFDGDVGNCSRGQAPALDFEGTVGCVPFPETQIAPNDCLPFPELQTQSGDKLIGVACSECIVELFWADNDPSNNDDAFGVPHGEGSIYIVSGVADEDGNFSIDLPCDLGPGDLTATATDKLKNTSEFSANLITLGTSGCATDTPVPPDTLEPTITPVPTDPPEPTDEPEPTNTPEPPKVCGDVNEDGVANSVDASLVLQFKAGLISSLPNESSGDVNGDGALTSVDAALLLQFTAALIDEGALTC